MATPLAELLATPSADDVKEKLLGGLVVDEFPITDWYSGGVARTLVETTAAALADLVGEMIPLIAAGGLVDEAEDDWLALLVLQNYDLAKTDATFTRQYLTLTAALGTSSRVVSPGDLIALSVAGNRYILNDTGTIDPALPVKLEFKAESPGSKYNDGAGQITTLVTSIAGVTVENVAESVSPVSRLGIGLGTITPSAADDVAPTTVVIAIVASGQAGSAMFSYSLSGAPYSPPTLAPVGAYTLPGGAEIVFNNDTSANPSFIVGDRYLFTVPGSPIIAQGRDAETDQALRARAHARWPALSLVPTADKYELWAFAADPQVNKVTVRPSLIVPGQVDIVIAGAVNPLGAPVVAAVQDFIDQRAGITDLPSVSAAVALSISTSATLTLRSRDVDAFWVAAQLAWDKYLGEVPIGGTVRASKLEQILMDAGAVDVVSPAVAGVQNAGLATNEVAQALGALVDSIFPELV